MKIKNLSNIVINSSICNLINVKKNQNKDYYCNHCCNIICNHKNGIHSTIKHVLYCPVLNEDNKYEIFFNLHTQFPNEFDM